MNELRDRRANDDEFSSAAKVPVYGDKVPPSVLVKTGGFFGIAGSILGLVLLIAGCAGFGKALSWSVGSIGAGAFGLLIALLGGFVERRKLVEETHVLQALFASFISILGGVLEYAVWMKWPIFK